MTELIMSTWYDTKKLAKDRRNWRCIIPFFYLILFLFVPNTRIAIIQSMSDAFITVAVFVSATLFLFYGSEKLFKFNSDEVLKKHKKWQIVISAILGALPGCGGAIIVVSQYVKGVVGFSSLIAVLTATMGDAAFLILAKDPGSGFILLLLGLASGIIFGYIVNVFHCDNKFKLIPSNNNDLNIRVKEEQEISRPMKSIWLILMSVGLVFGIMD